MHEQQKYQFSRLDRLSKKLNDLCDELNLTNLKINDNDDKIKTKTNSSNNNENTKQSQVQQQLECQLNLSSTQQHQQQSTSLLANRAKFNLTINLDSLKNLKRVSTKINVILFFIKFNHI